MDQPPRAFTPLFLALAILSLTACGDRLAQREGETELQWGERLYGQLGCPACHSLSGARLQGPPAGQVWGAEVRLRSGETVVRDEEYVRRSIVEPNAQVVDGYFPVMIPVQDLTPEQLDVLVAFWRDRSVERE